MGSGDLAAFESFVRRRTGLAFSEARMAAFEAALHAGMRRARAPDPAVYLARLETEEPLLEALVDEITTGETYFFRDPQQLAQIRDRVVPSLLAGRRGDRPLRAWSAGCASGEEAYTLAILLRESGFAGEARILGTDLSHAALARARAARYAPWSLRGVPDAVVRRHFTRVRGRFALSSAIRDAVVFRHLNLAGHGYPSAPAGLWGMDLILCRNVLIYFDAETVAHVARGLIDSLGDEGWLLLGASDPVLTDLVPCEVVVTAAGLAYRRPDARGAGAAAHAAHPPVPAPVADAFITDPPSITDVPSAACDGHEEPPAAEPDRRAAQRGEDEVGSWIVLVRDLANRGELDAAGRACAAALDRHRVSAELAYLHALLLAGGSRHAEAAAAARRALYLDRTLAVAHLALGDSLARTGDTGGARRAFRNAEAQLAAMAPGEAVPASGGEPAAGLVEMARARLRALDGEAA